jgi:hypothetical protein
MPIEIRGPEHLLEELRLFLGDQFLKRGYEQGPKIGSMDSGGTVNFAKGEDIVTVHIKEEDEGSLMYVESEKEIPELNDIWDDAIITYGKEVGPEPRVPGSGGRTLDVGRKPRTKYSHFSE